MNIGQIEENLSNLIRNFSRENFIYELLLAYGLPKTTITLLKKGKHNLSKKEGQIILKKKLFFQESENQDLHALIDSIQKDKATHRHNPRFIIVTDYKTILAVDTKTKDTLDEKIFNLDKCCNFFAPWAGMEKANHKNENPADVKAAEKMAKIYDEIQKDNQFNTKEDLHSLNTFLSRLLFCFFAEDTGIFKLGAFTNGIASHTQNDGSDLDQYLDRLFEALNTQNRSNYPDYLSEFPYVNGGLFGDKYFAPKFSVKSRRLIIECGKEDWKDINPDIFGSMIQAVVHTEQRGSMGMHYTSVPNIMKVIEPLFLNELKEEFEKNYDNEKKLNQLLTRLENLRIFDPACGSGNFLIIAYKEIKNLEIEVYQRIQQITKKPSFAFSRVKPSQFYGIELDDFACEVATLSLWLAEHQMNVKFKAVFGQANPTLPLKDGGKIVCGNATRINWEEVCAKDEGKEIYILGNPPYLGSSIQNKSQKDDLAQSCKGFKNYKNLDYIACWFVKGAQYIKDSNAELGFVSTNSICQGEQVGLLWPNILDDLEISFAHQSFKWSNSAKSNAGVICIVIGLANKSSKPKSLYKNNICSVVSNINPYLTSGKFIPILRRSQNISELPTILWGNKASDGGFLNLDYKEKNDLITKEPLSKRYLKKYIGSQEFIKGIERWCLWISDNDLPEALKIEDIRNRVEEVRKSRLESPADSTQAAASKSHRFIQIQHEPANALIIPSVSSENRDYIPIGFVKSDTVVNAQCYVIYHPQDFIFGIISSRMHMVWVRAVAGRLKTDYRYSSALCYCSFPFPSLTEKQKNSITDHVYNVMEEREKYPEKTMSDLYDPKKMPAGLRKAHQDLDVAIELCYRSKPFTSDEERLEHLFRLYEEMTSKEKVGGK